MNPFEFVIAVIVIVGIFKVIRYRMGDPHAFERPHFRRRDRMAMLDDRSDPDPETGRLTEEVRQLKERIQVLERIAVDKENTLARQIEELRDRG